MMAAGVDVGTNQTRQGLCFTTQKTCTFGNDWCDDYHQRSKSIKKLEAQEVKSEVLIFISSAPALKKQKHKVCVTSLHYIRMKLHRGKLKRKATFLSWYNACWCWHAFGFSCRAKNVFTWQLTNIWQVECRGIVCWLLSQKSAEYLANSLRQCTVRSISDASK